MSIHEPVAVAEIQRKTTVQNAIAQIVVDLIIRWVQAFAFFSWQPINCEGLKRSSTDRLIPNVFAEFAASALPILTGYERSLFAALYLLR
jgi:hypothetical protein